MTRAKAITNDITQNIKTQKMLLRVLIYSSIVLCAVYLYLVGSITFNVIARRSLENTVVTLTNNVNQLELTYLNNIKGIDKNYAFSKGFVDVRQNIFVARSINHVAIR
jgi:cell division septal protein FtsQ